MKQTSALTDDEAIAIVRAQWRELAARIEKCTVGMQQALEARGLSPEEAFAFADLAYLRELFIRRSVFFAIECGGDVDSLDFRAQFVAWVEEEWDAWDEEVATTEAAET